METLSPTDQRGTTRPQGHGCDIGAFELAGGALQSQTISFGALANHVFGTAPFGVSATASSGLPVSFNSQTTSVCTVSGSTVTMGAVGTCTIQATQAGNTTYAGATPVNQSFQVTLGTQLVVTRSLSRDPSTGDIVLVATITNSGGAAASNVRLTVAKIGSTVTKTTLPQSLGTIAAGGAFTQVTVRFNGSVGLPGAATTVTLSGTYTGGSFATTARVTLP